MIFRLKLPQLAQNLIAYGASEAASKASRLVVVIVVARTLDLAQIGVAAAALAAADILKSLTENGIGQKIIAARDEDLAATCATAHRLFWIWCLALFVLQALVGFGLYFWTGNLLLFALILLLAGEYLFMPAGLVQCALAMRAGKLKQTAAIAGSQVVSANLMSAALAFVWSSPLALILPRLLTAPFWLICMRRLHPWTRDLSQGFAPVRPFVIFGRAVLGVELVKSLRLQIDKVIVGALMGTETLGLYFMAFNAGLGLANSFSTAFSTVLFPHFCSSSNKLFALRQSIGMSIGLISPVVILQALMAYAYVPILFGPGWSDVDQVVSILCFVAIPTTLWSAVAGYLRATGGASQEFRVTLLLTVALSLNAIVMAPFGLTALAIGYAVVATGIMLAAALPFLQRAFAAPVQEA
ncbi:MAG: oligosaccharide flippase family protein [Arenibacterium sp.]